MTIKTDDDSFFIKDPEYNDITEKIEDEINVTEESVRLFYKMKEEYTSALNPVFTVKEIEIYNTVYKPAEINNISSLPHDVENSQKERKLIQKKPSECQICFKTFSTNGNLKKHIDIHTGDAIHKRKFQCDICGKSFGRKYRLVNHVRSHNGDGTYEDKKFKFECKVCGKLVKEKREFEDHMRVHTGERPFQCDLCHLSFKQRSSLRRHSSVHTGELSHKCEV
ncbi:Hypothetical predicted protein, partial [Mytilus galloprovincialis]